LPLTPAPWQWLLDMVVLSLLWLLQNHFTDTFKIFFLCFTLCLLEKWMPWCVISIYFFWTLSQCHFFLLFQIYDDLNVFPFVSLTLSKANIFLIPIQAFMKTLHCQFFSSFQFIGFLPYCFFNCNIVYHSMIFTIRPKRTKREE
jgi:hypothetical protein